MFCSSHPFPLIVLHRHLVSFLHLLLLNRISRFPSSPSSSSTAFGPDRCIYANILSSVTVPVHVIRPPSFSAAAPP